MRAPSSATSEKSTAASCTTCKLPIDTCSPPVDGGPAVEQAAERRAGANPSANAQHLAVVGAPECAERRGAAGQPPQPAPRHRATPRLPTRSASGPTAPGTSSASGKNAQNCSATGTPAPTTSAAVMSRWVPLTAPGAQPRSSDSRCTRSTGRAGAAPGLTVT